MELRSYQREALERMLDAGRFVYGDGAGTGKTATTLTWLREIGAKRPLIAVPDNVHHQWMAQAEEWYPELEITDGRGTPKRRAELRECPGALLINHELVRQDRALIEQRFDALVVDESQAVKERQAQLFKAMRLSARRVPYLALLTGTPIMNRADEAWAALHMIDPQRWSSYHRWAREHFEYDMTTFHGKLPRPVPVIGEMLDGHDEIVAAEVGEHLIARPIDYCLPDLPPQAEYVMTGDFTDPERRIYDSLRKKGWADMNGTIVKTKSAGVASTRLRQVTSDWNGIAPMPTPGTKVRSMNEYLREGIADEQVVVIVGFQETAEQLARALYGESVDYIHGDKPKDVRLDTLARFKAGDTRVLIGTHPTLGTGVDGLQCARNIELLDQDWTPSRNDQAIARVRRSGQTADVVNVGRTMVNDSADDNVQAANDHKRGVIDRIVSVNYR